MAMYGNGAESVNMEAMKCQQPKAGMLRVELDELHHNLNALDEEVMKLLAQLELVTKRTEAEGKVGTAALPEPERCEAAEMIHRAVVVARNIRVRVARQAEQLDI